MVEDDPLLRMMALEMVERVAFEAVEAAAATQAARVLTRRTDIGIVLTDIDVLRGMEGMRLAAAIRARWLPIEIIPTLGYVPVPDVDPPGGAVFFPKPYRGAHVVAEMRRMAA